MNATAPLSATDRFVMALEGLHRAVAARFRSGVITVAMIWAVCNRIRRVERRVQRLMRLFLAGRLAPEAASGARARRESEGRPRKDFVSLPRRFGWLLPLVPCEAANFASQLRASLAQPEMQALLAASPKARLALRPLCRMLAIEAEVIAPKPVTAEAETEGAAEETGRAPPGPWAAETPDFPGEPPEWGPPWRGAG